MNTYNSLENLDPTSVDDEEKGNPSEACFEPKIFNKTLRQIAKRSTMNVSPSRDNHSSSGMRQYSQGV